MSGSDDSMKVLCADIIQVTSVTWQHLSLVNSPYSDDFLQFTITAWLTTYLEDVTEDLCPLWEYSFRRWDVNIMVGVVYKCTLNLVSPAPVSTDWLSASVLSALPPSQLARATCQASVATATRSKYSKSPDWLRTRAKWHKCTTVLWRIYAHWIFHIIY